MNRASEGEPSESVGGLPVESATADQVDRMTRTLSQAFATDPFFQWMLEGQWTSVDDLEHRLHHFFRALSRVQVARTNHLVDVVDGGAGVAIWYDVDAWRLTKSDSARLLPGVLRTYGSRLRRAMKAQSMVEAVHPKEPHRHLAYLATATDRQGGGLGSLLLRSATEACDRDGVDAYLENLNPRNTPLYRRFGFADLELIPLPPGAPPVLAMWRPCSR